MESLRQGQIVYSKAGRDKGRVYVVLNVDGGYAYLADGTLRGVGNPKKKKLMHIQPVNSVGPDIKTDHDIRKALKEYENI